MLTGVSNVFTASGQKPAENQNQQAQPNTEEQGQSQAAPSQSNSGSSQSSNAGGAAQAQTAVSSSKAANTSSKSAQPSAASQAASNENAEASSSFNDSAYTRRVAERVQAEMIMNSVFTSKAQSSVLPSLFASGSQEAGTTNKAVLSEYMKNSEPA